MSLKHRKRLLTLTPCGIVSPLGGGISQLLTATHRSTSALKPLPDTAVIKRWHFPASGHRADHVVRLAEALLSFFTKQYETIFDETNKPQAVQGVWALQTGPFVNYFLVRSWLNPYRIPGYQRCFSPPTSPLATEDLWIICPVLSHIRVVYQSPMVGCTASTDLY